ncbi:THAP domain-containing protein 11-like [Saccostrea echinata]|uniref:THAP domain-containing protein 11-like n=1 Tax=Saccostrea echinata TaxID=191078 RepID=UPI002A7FD715|nr:THAP domain-containing protein 11-like [Saccostrea echinata]
MSCAMRILRCVAEGCNSDERKRGRYGYMKDVRFYPFPTQKKTPAQRKRWLDLLRRENYEPKRNHRVCSLHFKEGRPTEDHPYPELFAYNNFKESLKIRSTTSISKRKQCIVQDPHSEISVPPPVDSLAANERVLHSQINNDNSIFVSGELNGSWPITQEIEVSDHERPTAGSFPDTGEIFERLVI